MKFHALIVILVLFFDLPRLSVLFPVLLDFHNSELDKCCYGMCGVPSTVTNESIFRIPVPAKISCHVPENNMTEAVTRDMASSDWLKLEALCLFRAQCSLK